MRLQLLIFALVMVMGNIFSPAHADRAVRFFGMLKHTKGQFAGVPFTLLPWEERIIRDVYGTIKPDGTRQYRYAYIEVPKKNGKSELAAGASLFQTYADGEKNGEVYGCAADRQQASIVFDVAVDMIDQVPALKKRTKLQLSHKRLTDKISGTFYQVLSAEAFTKHGLNVSAVIFDELHAQPNRQLWDVMTFGAGDARRQPIWWIITTAGEDPDRVSIGWEQHEYAASILAGDKIDPAWYPVIYGYDGDDIYNEDHWALANPSLGSILSIDSLREAAARARNKPAEERLFRWLRLNQWVTTKLTTWLPVDLFSQTTKHIDAIDLIGKKVYLGLDLSSTTDLSALCVLFPPQPGLDHWYALWHAWIPAENMQERIDRDRVPYDRWVERGWITATEGNVIDYTHIEEQIIKMTKIYDVQEVDLDRAFSTMLVQRLENAGIKCVDVPQTYVTLTDPMNQLEVLLKSGQMLHAENDVARWCFGNTSIATNGSGLLKYVKEQRGKSAIRTKRIDLTAAWVIAMARARHFGSDASVYETRGLLVL